MKPASAAVKEILKRYPDLLGEPGTCNNRSAVGLDSMCIECF